MREILVKGKRKDNGEWIEGYLCIKYFQEIPHDRFVIQYKPKNNTYDWQPKYMVAEVDPETVRQFTGLYDSTKWEELTTEEQAEFLYPFEGGLRNKEDWKGKPIFEGDIVNYNDAHKFSDNDELEEAEEQYLCTDVIKFKNGRFYPLPHRCDCEDYYYSYGSYNFKVIGNIHDNLELLKKV